MQQIVPPKIRRRLAGRSWSFPRVPAGIARRMRTAERIRISEHAARYRIVTDGPHAGPWRHAHAPHTVKIMDTYGLPWVREVWFCGVEQSGKTNTMLNCMHWAADCDPGDIFYMMPTEQTMAKITGGRIKPMIQQSPRLRRHLTGRQDDITMARIKLAHGVTIHPSWANSPASMATWPAKHCFGDEIDKGAELAGREADRVTLLRKRTRLYRGRAKLMFGSTPAGLFIYQGMLSCPQVWEYRLRCPDCDALVRLEADHLDLDDLDLARVEAGAQVNVICPACGALWDDVRRETAIRTGRWHCVKGADNPRPPRVGFHHRAWECLDVPLSEIAAAWLRSKNGDVADRIAWANGYEAIDYSYEQVDREEDYILRLRDESMPRSVVPADTACVLVIADTQQTGFHYAVTAISWGSDMTVTVVEHGFVMSFKHLTDLAARTWHDAEDNEYRAQSGWIDSGGGTNPQRPKHSRTVEVYNFCRANPFWRPIKGRRAMEASWQVKRLDYYPSSVGKKVPIRGGLNLYTINVTLHKDELSRRLQVEPGDPGGIVLHAGVGSDYARQLCAEYQDERGWWLCPKGRDNHQWDILVYCLAATDILGVRNWSPEPVKPGFTVYSRGIQPS